MSAINVLAELERIGWDFEPSGDNEISCCCPAHDDSKPSVNLNTEKKVWKCHAAGCQASGDIITFLALALNVERSTMIVDLSDRYDLKTIKTINPEMVEKYHLRIWDSGPLLTALRERGVTDDLVRKHRLGFNEGRITIPVFDEKGRVVNIRKYLPGAPGPEKMKNTKGYSGPRFYLVDQVEKFSKIMVCGGEMKAIVASSLLNKHGIGCVSVTGGEGTWDASLSRLLRDKRVYICMDVDGGGRSAARKLAGMLCFDAKSVRIVHLPLDTDKYPTGDINDWVAKEGATDEDFLKVLMSSEIYQLPDADSLDSLQQIEQIDVQLSEAARSEYIGRSIRVEALVTAMDTTPFLVPREVGVYCTKDQSNCYCCPVRPIEQDEETQKVTLTIKGTSYGLLDMVNAPKKYQRDAILTGLKMPPCKVAELTVRTYHTIRDVRLTPQLYTRGENKDHVVQSAFICNENVELNVPYIFTGRVYPHPRTQQAILLFDGVEQAPDSLVAYTPSEDALRPLLCLRPKSWTLDSLGEKLDDIYTDLESNVTRIYDRRDLHLILDLTWHSVLYFHMGGRLQNGWVNTLIIGDSAQGKSEASLRLLEHYGTGVRHECKNATTAGLLGGLQQIANRWFVSWGVIPQNDRRLVIMEEIKGASTEILGHLTDMRSSGVAELSKIEKRMAHARTRLVMISNPRSDRPISAYNFGIEAIRELVGALEDIRRFDAAIVLSRTDVDAERINSLNLEQQTGTPVYSSDLCRSCVLWAWTRTPDQVKWDEDAEQDCIRGALELCKVFTEALPLVDRGTMRFKIARLAAALAARTFSTPKNDPNVLLIRRCHVAYIIRFLLRHYSSSTFGYGDYSRAVEYATSVTDPRLIRKHIVGTKHPKDFVEALLFTDRIFPQDLCDWCELDRDEGSKLVSFLVRKHALIRDRRWYVKTAEFISLLKELRVGDLPEEAVAGKDEEF